MGLIDNGSGIILDTVITDVGRAALARGDGSFEVVKFSVSDDEIDYTLFNPNTGSLQQDTNILNTPIFEASVNEKILGRNELITISNPDLKYIPKLTPNVTSISLGERTDSQVGKSIEFTQTIAGGRIVPAEIVDGSFIIQVNSELLFVERETPTGITSYGTAQYVVPKTATAASQGSQVTFNIAVQSLSSDLWTTLGTGTVGSRTITTKVKCKGALSGLSSEITVIISEEFSR